MTWRARQVLEEVPAVAGYTTYLELVRPIILGKKVISTGMKKEVKRVWAAVETVISGTSCALACGGDPGIYALAGLVFELCRENRIGFYSPGEKRQGGKNRIAIEVVPGVPALSAGAALLGAPLMHDFAAISLSDLLTPWEIIEKRLHAAAEADFVIVLYNPRSKKRNRQLPAALKIILESRPPSTPAGIVTGAMRENQNVRLLTLETLEPELVGMQTTLFIGNSRTFTHENKMITPRGYGDKYDLKK